MFSRDTLHASRNTLPMDAGVRSTRVSSNQPRSAGTDAPLLIYARQLTNSPITNIVIPEKPKPGRATWDPNSLLTPSCGLKILRACGTGRGAEVSLSLLPRPV